MILYNFTEIVIFGIVQFDIVLCIFYLYNSGFRAAFRTYGQGFHFLCQFFSYFLRDRFLFFAFHHIVVKYGKDLLETAVFDPEFCLCMFLYPGINHIRQLIRKHIDRIPRIWTLKTEFLLLGFPDTIKLIIDLLIQFHPDRVCPGGLFFCTGKVGKSVFF